MDSRYSRYIHIIHFIGDILVLNLAFFLSFWIKFKSIEPLFIAGYYSQLILFFNLFWVIVVFLVKLYDIYRVTRVERIVLNLFRALGIHLLLIFAIIVIQKSYNVSRYHLLITYSIFLPLLFSWRFLVLYLLSKYRTAGYNYRKVIVIGTGHSAKEISAFFRSDLSKGYHFMGYFDDNVPDKTKITGTIADIPDYCKREKIDEIFCALPLFATEQISEIMRFAENNLIRFKIVPDFRALLYKRVNIDFFNTIPVLVLRNEPLENVAFRIIKRIFDIVFSLLVILLIFPWFLPLMALLIKLSSKGPVFFKQLRSGKNNKEFMCYKFRTMRVNIDADKLQATKDDPRITKIGSFLRKSNLDELPQFINVFIGNMSVVGPRPHMLKHTDDYSKIINRFMVRHFVKPGITGLAQVKGFRGETKTTQQMERRVQYDVWYIENWSFLLDLKIVFLTVWNMIKGEENAF